jgi:hypothetical protein
MDRRGYLVVWSFGPSPLGTDTVVQLRGPPNSLRTIHVTIDRTRSAPVAVEWQLMGEEIGACGLP